MPSPEDTTTTTTTPEKRTDFNQLNVGDYLSETQYYKITERDNNRIHVLNERGFTFHVSKNIVEEGMFSASQYKEEKKMSRSDVVEVFQNAKDCIFTVNFNKLPNEKSALDHLKEIKVSDLADQKQLKLLAKKMTLGEDRTLVGHLNHSEPRMGRSSVTDLEIPPNQYRIRLVDHRTINWLIINNVKYTVK